MNGVNMLVFVFIASLQRTEQARFPIPPFAEKTRSRVSTQAYKILWQSILFPPHLQVTSIGGAVIHIIATGTPLVDPFKRHCPTGTGSREEAVPAHHRQILHSSQQHPDPSTVMDV